MKFVLVSFIVLWMIPICLPVFSSPNPDWYEMIISTNPMSYRTDATMVLHFDTYGGLESNRAWLYGGRGVNAGSNEDIFIDSHGLLQSFRFVSFAPDQHGMYRWEDHETDPFYLRRLCTNPVNIQDSTDYPPHGRFAHSAIIIPSIEGQVTPFYNELAINEGERINYVVFGGIRQQNRSNPLIANNSEVTDELYVNAQYRISGDTRHHWYRVEPEPSQTWPVARCYAQMVPLFCRETEIEDGEYPFLVFGGLSASQLAVRPDAFVGTFKRELTPVDPGVVDFNEWNFEMCITVDFEETSPDDVFQVYGAGAVFDPYYGTVDNDGQPIPRVILVGGARSLGANPEGYKVKAVYPSVCPVTGEHDWVNPVVEPLPNLPDNNGSPQCRIHSAVVLNPRAHTLRVFGGEKQNGDPEPGILELDLTHPENGWQWVCRSFNASRHNAAYTNGTRIFRTVGDSVTGNSVMTWDISEATFDPPDEPFVWDVTPDAPYGMNNLNTIFNTPRLHSHDTVRVHQTRDVSGKVNDAYKTRIAVPAWRQNIVLEGVVKNGVKPVLYTLYSDYDNDKPLIPHVTRLGIIIDCGTSLTIRNLRFMHADNELTWNDDLPNEIPQWALNRYQAPEEGILHDMMNDHLPLYYDRSEPIWDFGRHHNKDPALWLHSPIHVSNCDFMFNGIGMTIICVSTAIQQAQILHNRFDTCYIGVLGLELHHHLAYNAFRNCYLAGVVFDKGCNVICRDNLFIGNGHGLNQAMEPYQSAVLSHFRSTDAVPNIQTPLVYNNTFVNNHRALSVTEHAIHGAQIMNRPFFFNNIVSNSNYPIYLQNSDLRCDFISFHNCFHAGDITPPVETGIGDVLSGWSLYDDPDFDTGDPDVYLLSDTSPCLDRGLYTLNPGVISELNYPDYGMLSIGFHQLPGTGLLPGSPSDLQILGYVLSWNPSTSKESGYLVLVETYAGNFIHARFTKDDEYSYDFIGAAMYHDHLFFWVMSHFNRRVYSDPVMIEWIE